MIGILELPLGVALGLIEAAAELGKVALGLAAEAAVLAGLLKAAEWLVLGVRELRLRWQERKLPLEP